MVAGDNAPENHASPTPPGVPRL